MAGLFLWNSVRKEKRKTRFHDSGIIPIGKKDSADRIE